MNMTEASLGGSDVAISPKAKCSLSQDALTDSAANKIVSTLSEIDGAVELAPPDTTYAWFIVVAAFFNLATTMGTSNSFGVYQEYYLNDLYKNDSAVVIAWISTLNIFCTFFGSVVTGKLTDEFGFRATCLAGAIICGVALILASFTHTVWQLMLTQGIMLGLGTSLVFSPSMSVVAQWHVKHRILATGIAVSGGGVGGMIISNATRRMIDGIGYRWSLRVLGLLITAISGSASLVYKHRMSAPKTGNSALLFNLFRDPRFLCINAALMFLDFAFYEPMLYMPTAAVNETGLKTTASNIVLVFNAGTAAGRVLSGPIAGLLGPHNTNLAANGLICVLIFVFMQGVKTIAGYYAFISLYGILCTLYLAINAHILADEFGTQAIATAVGLNTACSGIGSLVGNPVLGALYENYDRPHDRFTAVTVWAGMSYAIVTLCYAALRFVVARKHNYPHFSKM